MTWMARLKRKIQLAALARAAPAGLRAAGERRLLRAFRRAAAGTPAYAALLKANGVDPAQITSIDAFLAQCPVLTKESTFGRFPLEALCLPGALGNLAEVLTSSGHGNRFAFGLIPRGQVHRAVAIIDLGLQFAFDTDRKRTLLINTLPMGVRFSSSAVTVAETSAREDMTVALLEQFGPHFDQIILVADPLFCKRLLDYADERSYPWGRIKTHVILSQETFGEAFRAYVEGQLGIDPEDAAGGLVGSSMGVGELGLNLFFETRETVALRRLAHADPDFRRALLPDWPHRVPPLFFAYNPLRTFCEVQEPDAAGFGRLTLSTLDARAPLPLLRYQTGDRARILDHTEVAAAYAEVGRAPQSLPALPLIALAGREQDLLPDGRAILDLKDALYLDPELAAGLTGAFRCEQTQGEGCHIQVQLRADAPVDPYWQGRLADLLPQPQDGLVDRVTLWPYGAFPFGMGLDYERKFHYQAAEARPERRG